MLVMSEQVPVDMHTFWHGCALASMPGRRLLMQAYNISSECSSFVISGADWRQRDRERQPCSQSAEERLPALDP